MKLIVGLGNPGEKYERTRHNMGFAVADQFVKNFETAVDSIWEDSAKFKSDIKEIEWQSRHNGNHKVIVVKPKTYMNNSGLAVSLLSSYYKISPEDIWIIHDDIDLPLGSLRIRFGGGAAGHKGVTSVMDNLKTEKFWRFRLGVGHPKNHAQSEDKKVYIRDVEDFVLTDFTSNERGKVKDLIKRSAKAIASALEEGLNAAMNRFNTK